MSQKTDIRLSDCLVVPGQQSYVAYALRENGEKEAEEYYGGLERTIQASFMRKFKLVADGEQLPKNQFRKLTGTDGIFEFKHYEGYHIFCFKGLGGWWLAHGHYDKNWKVSPEQTKRAEMIKQEHSNWNIV